MEIAFAEEAFHKDKVQLAETWAQRAQQFQQAVDLQVCRITAVHSSMQYMMEYSNLHGLEGQSCRHAAIDTEE